MPQRIINSQAKMMLMYVYLAKFLPKSSWICRIDSDAYFVYKRPKTKAPNFRVIPVAKTLDRKCTFEV